MLEKGTYGTIAEIAAAEKINESYVGRVLRLTLLAPDIVEAVLNGRQPGGDDTGGVDATVSGGLAPHFRLLELGGGNRPVESGSRHGRDASTFSMRAFHAA